MSKLIKIEKLAKDYAQARETLTEIVAIINRQLEGIYAVNMKDLRRAVAIVRELESHLKNEIEANPALFDKPKTQIFHGIKVGYRKGTGAMDWEDDAAVVKLIRKHFPDLADTLIHTEETPVKGALKELTTAEIKKLGITVEDTGEVIVIKPVDTAVDKTVKALLKQSPEEAT